MERQDEHQTADVNDRVMPNGQEERTEGKTTAAQSSDPTEKDFCAAGERINHENQTQIPPAEPLVDKVSDEAEEAPQRKRSRPPKKDYR